MGINTCGEDKTALNTFIVIDVPIGLIHKLNTTNMYVATLSNHRLVVLRRRKKEIHFCK